METNMFVRVSVADVREEPDQRSELFSQLLLGDQVTILDSGERWLRCRLSDGNEGWMHRGFLAHGKSAIADRTTGDLLGVRALATAVYEEPDTRTRPLLVLPDGVQVAALKLVRHWYEVLLPTGIRGWSPARYLRPLIEIPPASGSAIAEYARLFIGVPYLWGGTSSFGFDCSGFTQHIFRVFGIALPRNSGQQAIVGEAVDPGPDYSALQPGDLLFFADTGRVNHVAISLGGATVAHASIGNGQSAIDDLLPGMEHDNPRLAGMFHSARRIVTTP